MQLRPDQEPKQGQVQALFSLIRSIGSWCTAAGLRSVRGNGSRQTFTALTLTLILILTLIRIRTRWREGPVSGLKSEGQMMMIRCWVLLDLGGWLPRSGGLCVCWQL